MTTGQTPWPVDYTRDSAALADIGRELDEQLPRLTVTLSRSAAQTAVAAWERDDQLPTDGRPETPAEQRHRDRAATLALIGLGITERGVWDGDHVTVDLDVAFIGAAVTAALESDNGDW